MIFLIVVVDFLAQLVSSLVGWGRINRGVSFGLGEGIFPGIIFGGLVVFLAILLLIGKLTELGWKAVLAGGISNTMSRLSLGGVRDYFHWPFGFDLWFNLADVAIVVGMAAVLLQMAKENGERAD